MVKPSKLNDIKLMVGATGFEPAVSALTGPHVRPLHHAPKAKHSLSCQIMKVKKKREVILSQVRKGSFPVGKQRLIVEATTKPGREKHGLI